MIRSLHIIDSLNIGGAERMAVNIANSLARKDVESHICATRAEGNLKFSIDKSVNYFFLNKKTALDFNAIIRLSRYIKNHKINILHAHGTSFFVTFLVSFFVSNVKIVWHDHYGNRPDDKNILSLVMLKICSYRFSVIYSVNIQLKEWAKKKLNSKRVELLHNYPTLNQRAETHLKGNPGKRILSIANLRKPKNHQLLFEAFKEVVKEFNEWSLHCVGHIYNDEYSNGLKKTIEDNNLENHIFLYGSRNDVSNIISQSSIGVLSSTSEGLPMALLEYGLGKLPVIATDVGHCAKLILDDSYGLLVPNGDREAYIDAIKTFISNFDYMKSSAIKFHDRVVEEFSETKVIDTIIEDYRLILESA